MESIAKKGFYVRRPNAMTWQMNPPRGSRRTSPDILDRWGADADEAGLEHHEEISVAIEDASVMILGTSAGNRLGLPGGSRVLVRRAVRYTRPVAAELLSKTADSLADEYYPYDLVRDTELASPAPASPVAILAGLGHKLRGHTDEIRPRVATTEERRLLSLPQVSVVLELARTAHDTNGTPVLVLHQIRRGDGATFHYDIVYPSK